MYRQKQPLSSDQGPAGSGQTASLGVPSRGRVGSPGLGPSPISGPNSRASSSSQVPARPQNYTFPVAKVLFYLSSGDLGLIPSVVGCPPVNGASCRSVGEVSSGKSLGLARLSFPAGLGGLLVRPACWGLTAAACRRRPALKGEENVSLKNVKGTSA